MRDSRYENALVGHMMFSQLKGTVVDCDFTTFCIPV